ncbi:lytic polysaccharide monooxygenase auxiliary activity family 9 protein [Saccharothrix sp. HUAS TT1]|uniref:lytic polysaccharide monooxygenase auxiliary activity family 9 protein n=1 Tax=unclassified Saccharothrix TaxID=2593673 RepID=UPI00345C0C9A
MIAVEATRKPVLEHAIPPGSVKHGYTTKPVSRAYWCALNKPTAGCGAIGNEPQSVEGPKGFPAAGPPDGQLASGGLSRFGVLDGPTAPGGKPWPATAVTPGAPLRVRWWLTAPHRTARWHYWITRQGWNPGDGLTRDALELVANVEWTCPDNANWKCYVPVKDTHHFLYLPRDRTGRHVLLAIWDVADTGNAFYQAADLDFAADSQRAGDFEGDDDEVTV